ncbi:MAG: hypothetical protein V4597_08275 [Pseudomonadota bacterium]
MPDAPLRPCAGGCGALVRKGRCPTCAPEIDRRRGTASARGYGQAWIAFRPVFIASLVAAGVMPVCGASLPAGPKTVHSACEIQGLLTFASADGSSLHLDHEPPLRDEERTSRAAVCDPLRIQLLCASCHARKDLPRG